MSAADACIALILKEEGGYTANAKDPGNWTGGKVGVGTLLGTKYGIAAHANPGVDIKNLTVAQATEIYRRKYWAPAGCDALPAGLDLAVFDPAVNNGVSRAKTFLAGTSGAVTVRIKQISTKRRAFYQGLSTFKTFGKGWLARVARIEAAALKMALQATGASQVQVKEQLLAEANASNKKKTAAEGVAYTAPAPGVAVAAGDVNWGALFLLGAAIIAVVVVAIRIHKAHQERANALIAEANS